MSRNQLHGLAFEDCIRTSGLFPGAAEAPSRRLAAFDIDACYDPDLGLPTSIKTMSKSDIGLADARRIWEAVSTMPFRLLVGDYIQTETHKVITEVYTFIVNPDMAKRLLGSISLQEVTDMHEAIQFEVIPKGQTPRARALANDWKRRLAPSSGAIQLMPKIDNSETQRRVQCLIKLKALKQVFWKHQRGWDVESRSFGGLALPIAIPSTERERS